MSAYVFRSKPAQPTPWTNRIGEYWKLAAKMLRHEMLEFCIRNTGLLSQVWLKLCTAAGRGERLMLLIESLMPGMVSMSKVF